MCGCPKNWTDYLEGLDARGNYRYLNSFNGRPTSSNLNQTGGFLNLYYKKPGQPVKQKRYSKYWTTGSGRSRTTKNVRILNSKNTCDSHTTKSLTITNIKNTPTASSMSSKSLKKTRSPLGFMERLRLARTGRNEANNRKRQKVVTMRPVMAQRLDPKKSRMVRKIASKRLGSFSTDNLNTNQENIGECQPPQTLSTDFVTVGIQTDLLTITEKKCSILTSKSGNLESTKDRVSNKDKKSNKTNNLKIGSVRIMDSTNTSTTILGISSKPDGGSQNMKQIQNNKLSLNLEESSRSTKFDSKCDLISEETKPSVSSASKKSNLTDKFSLPDNNESLLSSIDFGPEPKRRTKIVERDSHTQSSTERLTCQYISRIDAKANLEIAEKIDAEAQFKHKRISKKNIYKHLSGILSKQDFEKAVFGIIESEKSERKKRSSKKSAEKNEKCKGLEKLENTSDISSSMTSTRSSNQSKIEPSMKSEKLDEKITSEAKWSTTKASDPASKDKSPVNSFLKSEIEKIEKMTTQSTTNKLSGGNRIPRSVLL